MDCAKTGALIRTLRLEKGVTQKQLADRMNLSDKTISKWERGLGLPNVSLLTELSDILGVNLKDMLNGDLSENSFVEGNMKKSKYFVCPVCGNITVSTGSPQIFCCGRALEPLALQKASGTQKLTVQKIEDDWYITSDHPMQKDNYISFIAFATGDKLQMVKQYPEWDLQCRLPNRGLGMLIWYSAKEGAFYQYL